MKCPHCTTELVRPTADGTPMIRNRGILIKGGQLVLLCPKCKGDVDPSREVMKTFRILFLQRPSV